jgi:sugar phosphate isomerase/epimerase
MDAARPRLSLAAGVMPDFTPEQTVAAAAAAAGWDAAGIWVDMALWTPQTTREVKRRLADGGVQALDAEVAWIRPGPDDPDHFRLIDIAAELGAPNVLVVSSAPDAGETADKLGRLSDHAAAAGVRVSLEFGAFTTVRSLADALDVLERCGRPEAGLLVDPLHFARTGGRAADLGDVTPGRFAYAQFCDAASQGPSPEDVPAIIEEALDLRLMPGEGALPLADFVGVLPPGTPLSVELRSKALRDGYPDPVERSRALLAVTMGWVARAFKTPSCGAT